MEKNEILCRMLEIYKEIDRFAIDFEQVIGNSPEKINSASWKIANLVLDAIGIPADNTVELGLFAKDSFCRDYFDEPIQEFLDSHLTSEECINKIYELKKEIS
jgi:hypothetical protein